MNHFPISWLCKIASITRRSFYKWLNNGCKEFEYVKNDDLDRLVLDVYKSENGKYGYPRITIVLQQSGFKTNQYQVRRSMQRLNISSVIRVKKMNKKPKELKKITSIYPNIPNREWFKFKRNELWVTDVSYINLEDKYVYLSVIKDVYSGYIVGHKVSKTNDNKIYIDTWKEAIKFKKQDEKIIIHSDNGFQYTSIWARRFTHNNNLVISLSRPGSSLDNAACETFFSQLKTECPEVLKQHSYEHVVEKIEAYINYYNNQRITLKHKTTPFETYFKTEIKNPTTTSLLGSHL